MGNAASGPSSAVDTTATTTSPLASASVTWGTTTFDAPTTTTSDTSDPTVTATSAAGITVDGTVLVLARTANDASLATDGLNAYGIPYVTVIVPQTGVTLPDLNSSATAGNYGGFIVYGDVVYDYTATSGISNFSSALTPAQWTQLYNYQRSFSVRSARLNVYPSTQFDTIAVGGCCFSTTVDQEMAFTDVSDFPTAGLKTGAGISSSGLYHYQANITNASRTKQIAAWLPASDGSTGTSTAAVINNIDGRQQMVWFTGMATQWSIQTNYIQHSWINWITRGAYAGRRRSHFGTQVDDIHLATNIYYPKGLSYRIVPLDIDRHVAWQADINTRLAPGSNFTMELGHNGNGAVINATAQGSVAAQSCNPSKPIQFILPNATDLEYQKPLGTGTDIWPAIPTEYAWSLECSKLDALATWFTDPINRDKFIHISHTYAHMSLNNATYADADREIRFNIDWLAQMGLSSAAQFSKGLIPPAITGLHNGDVIRAWSERGIDNVVGDNTRPLLMQRPNPYWPATSTMAGNGFDGLTIVPRWSSTIYFDCDTLECCAAEWKAISSTATGVVADLVKETKRTSVLSLLALRHDNWMFHQLNLRTVGSATYTVGSVTGPLSLLQIWTETITQELTRLTNWPLVTLKQDALAQDFRDRQTRDGCGYKITYQYSADGKAIESCVVTAANGNTCAAPIPVTVPGDAVVQDADSGDDAANVRKDKVGGDPLIVWVTLSGSPVTITYSTPVAL